ncbi:DDE-type integrase/transposase/recombinase [Synechococcus lacustris]|uniref:DDE-type integrase/transposase/recombinase n=1 Tax=Synechococcus lacustris TaxID=2116544 RepID=UPI0020CE739C|nr:DDE-type integrase/transposase/recombinase [Synechococcus lacustris]
MNLPPPQRGGTPKDPAHLQRAPIRLLAARPDRANPGRARLPQEPRPVPRLRATGPNQVWSWDISYLPTSVKGIWLYLYLVIDVWSRKVVAWDVEECEDAKLAAELVSRACLKELISRHHKQPLILHADNGNALAAGFRAAIACCDAGGATGGTRSLEILLLPEGEQRQSLLGIVVPQRYIPA